MVKISVKINVQKTEKQQTKSVEPKTVLWEDKIDKPLTRLVSIMNDGGDNTTDSTDNRRITRIR